MSEARCGSGEGGGIFIGRVKENQDVNYPTFFCSGAQMFISNLIKSIVRCKAGNQVKAFFPPGARILEF